MKKQILNKLRETEEKHGVEILFAVESGSRAWGFASPDSDYDIRFVYKRKTEHYLSLWDKPDTIQFMTVDDLDGVGWDVKKATMLMSKSNASFLGWLFSPIIYMEKGNYLNEMKELAQANFNPVSGFYHFHSMNKGFNELVEEGKFTIKQFFYAMRTALCANWILKKGEIAPVVFEELFSLIDDESSGSLEILMEKKSQTAEAGSVAIPDSVFELAKRIVLENESEKDNVSGRKPNFEDFDKFFIKTISKI